MASISTITTLVSGVYTIYYIHPFIPYSFVWKYMAVPAFNYIATSSDQKKAKKRQEELEKELEFYEIIKETKDDNGVTTRYLILKTDTEYTMVNVEYDKNEPVWL